MGKVIAVEYLSLDGVMEEPAWSGPFFNDEVAAFQQDNLFGSDAMLLGRKTYEGFKQAWPAMEAETGEFGVKMNSMPKYVATTTLTQPEWNATFIAGDVADAVQKLKEKPETLLINGSGELFDYLTNRDLIDEYRLMIYPVVVGAGKRLFADAIPKTWALTKSQITSSGVAILTYVPAGRE
ncbi:dihydrofolate reductase family protein [Glaciibacter sp. 2TAF33]|uniref:dihydrofolate reductase family protein n=1 Tax=Glaciibacter sp. 2TAF33 TaxID=3233015 RepID=UPI003F8FA869